MGRVANKLVDAKCASCGKPFQRSHFNPYLVKCPECRGTKVAYRAFSSARHACCRAMLETNKRLGMVQCKCQERSKDPVQWYFFADGWCRKWGTTKVYYKGKFVGNTEYYGDLRKLMASVQKTA